MDRRGDGAQADLILAVFHSVALLADVGQLRRELLRRGERVRREGLELGVRENAAALRRRAVGKEKLALRRTVDRQARADLGHDAQSRAGFLLRQRHDRRTVENRQKYALAKLGTDALHMRPCDRADVPRVGDGAAVFKQPDAKPVAAVRHLLDQSGFAHRGQQTVDRALRPAGFLIKLRQGSGLAAFRQNVEKTDRLRNGVYGFAFLFCHAEASFLFIAFPLLYHAEYRSATGYVRYRRIFPRHTARAYWRIAKFDCNFDRFVIH